MIDGKFWFVHNFSTHRKGFGIEFDAMKDAETQNRTVSLFLVELRHLKVQRHEMARKETLNCLCLD